MPRDQILELLAHVAAALFRRRTVNEHGKRIDRLAIDHDRHLHEIAFAIAVQMVIERGITLGYRLQAVVEVEHHFIERQFIAQHGAFADIGQFGLDAAAVLAELEDAA
ncbi:hypothetical protein D3C73_736050 [compost metagenome]